ncbi:MAG: diadenylate cyclase, partial [Candidatus Hodarchaeota archaeon]
AVIVIFQEELRQFFEQVAVWSLNRRLRKRESMRLSHPEVETLARTIIDLSREKVGALIVIRGKDVIIRYLNGGIELGGKLSEPLLKSILDPHSIGHDGAVVIERGRITQFSCHLPLAKDIKSIGHMGTRHAAALGLAELTDAFCIVVSEERGSISLAHKGKIKQVESGSELSVMLDKFYQEISPFQIKKSWQDFFKKNSREKIIALGIAVALWFALVYGSKSVYKTYTVPIEYSVLPSTLAVKEIYPKEVDVTLSGEHRAFYFFNPKQITVFLKLWNLEKGLHEIKIADSDLLFPKKFVLEGIEPPAVKVHVEQNIQKKR